jgi:hypothetical protein
MTPGIALHMGLALARRLEEAEALNGASCVAALRKLNPAAGATVLEVAGGSAIFAGPGSPLTHAVALGMQGAVTPAELDRLQDFYWSRGSEVSVELCPMADASLIQLLAARGFRVTEFNNVMVRSVAGDFPPAETVRPAALHEEDLWSRTVSRGFLEKDDLTPDEIDVGRSIWHMPGGRCYLASRDGNLGGGAALAVNGDIATLFADSTLTGSRGLGLQSALIRDRLRVAASLGCQFAMAATLAGSISQRNYERNGFQVAYTKPTLTA